MRGPIVKDQHKGGDGESRYEGGAGTSQQKMPHAAMISICGRNWMISCLKWMEAWHDRGWLNYAGMNRKLEELTEGSRGGEPTGGGIVEQSLAEAAGVYCPSLCRLFEAQRI